MIFDKLDQFYDATRVGQDQGEQQHEHDEGSIHRIIAILKKDN